VKFWTLILFAVLFFSNTLVAKAPLNDLYQAVYLGEKSRGHYSGPLAPLGQLNSLDGSMVLLDDFFRENYGQHLIHEEIFRLSQMWMSDISDISSCPNHYLNQNLNYIRYLFRLLSMSYLFESMKQTNLTLHGLGFDRNSCSLSWHQTFSACKPAGEDMAKFVQRVQYRYLRDISQSDYVRMEKKEIGDWQKTFQQSQRTGKTESIVEQRILNWCQQKGIDCSTLSLEDIGKSLADSCQFDRDLIQKICSEKDELYGLSSIDGMIDLLTQSNIIGVINTGGYGKSCIERYVQIFKKREDAQPYLETLFPVVRNHLAKKNSAYLQGALFLPGALKEFDLKGLDNFLFVPEVTPPVAPVVVEAVEPAPVIIVPMVVPEPVVEEVVPEPIPEPVVMPAPPKRSQFALSYDQLIETKKERVVVDMLKFKDDFIFTEKMTNALREPLQDYQTRDALSDMQKYDFLGTRVEPLRLIFIKFLIDNEMHQGLFNIIAIIGPQFYVINDIDGEGAAVAVELTNDASSNYRWQLTLLRDDQVTNEKVMDDEKKKKGPSRTEGPKI